MERRSAANSIVNNGSAIPPVWDLFNARWTETLPREFLPTGSAFPASATVHSGAGRIVRLRMRPISLRERSLVPHTVSLRDLLSGSRSSITGDSHFGILDYANEMVGSGFPGIRFLSRPESNPIRLQVSPGAVSLVRRA